MSSLTADRCRHIKISGIQCDSPALRKKDFCFYHHPDRPEMIECYELDKYSTGEITLPYFEDAHSIQTVIRTVMQMVMQKRLEKQTASILLYALQIASSNLKRMELEKPQPEQVVVDIDQESKYIPAIAVRMEDETARESRPANAQASSEKSSEKSSEQSSEKSSQESREKSPDEIERRDEDLPPGSIQACYRPGPQTRNRQDQRRKRQYVV